MTCDSKHALLSWINASKGESLKDSLQTETFLSDIDIPLISDFNRQLAAHFGVLIPNAGSTFRGTAIISPDGVIKYLSSCEVNVGRNIDELLRLLSAFQFSEEFHELAIECPANWSPDESTNTVETIYYKEFRVKPSIRNKVKAGLFSLKRLFVSLFDQYNSILCDQPLLTKALTSGVICALGEVLASLVKNQSRNKRNLGYLSLRRIILHASYGMLVSGPIYHLWYNLLDQVSLSTRKETTKLLRQRRSVGLKVLIDQFVFSPIFLLVTLFYLKYFRRLDAKYAVRSIRNHYFVALLTSWKLWIPANVINFNAVPVNYQVLYGNLVSLWWNIYLSMTA